MNIEAYNNILHHRTKHMQQYIPFRTILREIRRADILLWAGNGGSGATASHMNGEFLKECRKRSVCLSDSTHVLTAIGNDVGYDEVFTKQYNVMRIPTGRNLLMVYSGSGSSPNIVNLVRSALCSGDYVVAFVGYRGSTLDNLCREYENCVCVDLEIDPAYEHAMQVSEDVHMVYSHILFRMCMELMDSEAASTEVGNDGTCRRAAPLTSLEWDGLW